MPYVLDESSYRIDKNTFPHKEEAKDRAEEAARILGRPITVYELVDQRLHFAFRVRPDGSVCHQNPLPNHENVTPSAPVVKGVTASAPRKPRPEPSRRELFDQVADTLERAGRIDLAAAVDEEAEAMNNPEIGLKKIVKRLKDEDV